MVFVRPNIGVIELTIDDPLVDLAVSKIVSDSSLWLIEAFFKS